MKQYVEGVYYSKENIEIRLIAPDSFKQADGENLAQDEAGERPKMDGGIFGRSPEAPQRSAQLLGKEKVLEKKLVAGQGFEPRLLASKASDLPLVDPASAFG